jgi:hypothetical protein
MSVETKIIQAFIFMRDMSFMLCLVLPASIISLYFSNSAAHYMCMAYFKLKPLLCIRELALFLIIVDFNFLSKLKL